MKKIQVFINLDENRATVRVTWEFAIFRETSEGVRRFVIERDNGGFSAIEKRDDGFYEVNYLKTDEGYEPIQEQEIDKEDAKIIIRQVLLNRFKEMEVLP